jgi:hypothetical protein
MPGFLASSGPVDLLASGTIIAFQDNPIEIVFETLASPLTLTSGTIPEPSVVFEPQVVTVPNVVERKNIPEKSGEWFKLIFRFIDEAPTAPDQTLRPPRIETKREEGALVLGITLFNFASPLGSGSTKPVQFGYSRERNLYLHYRVFTLAGGDKTLQFAVFQSRDRDHQPTPEATGEAKKQNG